MRCAWFVGVCLLVAPAAAQQASFGYTVSDRWPTGIHTSTIEMLPQDDPVCRTLADAANHRVGSKLLTPYHEPILGRGSLVEASWRPVSAADHPVEIIKELYRQEEAQWNRELHVEPGWSDEWEQKLTSGKARLEWTTLAGLRDDAAVTRVVRLMDDPAGIRRHTYLKSTMMAIVTGDFAKLQFIRGREPLDGAFTFQGRSYLFGISYRDWDNSFTVKFAEPQQEVWVDKSYEGPGANGPSSVVPICRLLYHQLRSKLP